jgi:hypothetical protein
MELIDWKIYSIWTVYRLKYGGLNYVYKRIPPCIIQLNGKAAIFLEHHWMLQPMTDQIGTERPSVDQLERLHRKRVLNEVPDLALGLQERFGVAEVVCMIIRLYTTIKK